MFAPVLLVFPLQLALPGAGASEVATTTTWSIDKSESSSWNGPFSVPGVNSRSRASAA